jgi:hypothetical protein
VARAIAKWEHWALSTAGLWWVSAEMVDLLCASALSVPDDLTFADLPPMPPSGFVAFEKPWVGHDSNREGAVYVDALVWAPSRLTSEVHERPAGGEVEALSLSSYRRLVFEDGLTAGELEVAARSGVLGEVTHGPPMLRAEANRLGVQNLKGAMWAPIGRSDWPKDEALGLVPPWEMTALGWASFKEDRQILAALWTLLQQEGITRQEVRPAQRQAARRTQRAGVAPSLSRVQVVTLRKLHRTESEPTDDKARVEWSRRWLVAGHWRWAAVGPGRSQRRLTFVRPHVKGPDDKPLVVRERVNAWVR